MIIRGKRRFRRDSIFQEAAMVRIGIAGYGIMGSRAAELYRQNGFEVHCFDIFPQARERAATAGFTVHETVAAMAAATDAALMLVPGPAETRETVAGLLAGAGKGYLILNASTIDPDTSIAMAGEAEKHGARYADTPLLGRPAGAGRWSFLVGCDTDTLTRIEPLLTILCGDPEKIFHMGPVGSGNKAKLLNNLMFGSINACIAEIMALADRIGLSRETLFNAAVKAGAGTVSNLYREAAPRIFTDSYANPDFTISMLAKDNRLALDMARKAGAPLTLGAAVNRMNEMAENNGLGSEDTAAMWKMVRAAWNSQA